MFLRWKKGELVTDLMWVRNERVESMITLRLRTSGDGEMVEPSMVRSRSSAFLSSALGSQP